MKVTVAEVSVAFQVETVTKTESRGEGGVTVFIYRQVKTLNVSPKADELRTDISPETARTKSTLFMSLLPRVPV